MSESDIADSGPMTMPAAWDDVRAALQDAISATNSNIGVLQRAHDGDADAARNAPKAADHVRDRLCSALEIARHHYASAGGRPNDLGLFYLSDSYDMPCSLMAENPRSATVIRHTVGISSFETFTGNGGQNEDQMNKNIIDDLGVRLRAGTVVTVLEHRRSFDEASPMLLCRSRIAGHQRNYWLACRDLRESRRQNP